MSFQRQLIAPFASLVLAIFGQFAVAMAADADVAVQQLLTGLRNPNSVAIRPDSSPAGIMAQPGQPAQQYDVVVCESGAGRIISARSDQPNQTVELVAGFPSRNDSAEGRTSAGTRGGIAGLLFLDYHRLVVGSTDPRKPVLRLYDIGGQALPIKADSPTQQVELPKRGGSNPSARTDACSLARTVANDHVADMLIVNSPRGDGGSGLWKVIIRADTLGDAAPLAADNGDSEQSIRSAATVSPQGFIVAVETDAENEHHHLAFLDPVHAAIVMRIPLDLHVTTALAYNPRNGNLYAAGSSSADGSAGGVFRLDDAGRPGQPAIAAVKVADVKQPTALAFGPDGALYVTALGGSRQNPENGALLKVIGGL